MHGQADAAAGGAVAAVLGDLTAYTVEVAVGKLPLRLGAHVIPIAIWSPFTGGEDILSAMAASLERARGRAILFVLGGASTPDKLAALSHAVIVQSVDGDADQAALRDAIRAVTPARDTSSGDTRIGEAEPGSGAPVTAFIAGLVLGAGLGIGGLLGFQTLRSLADEADGRIQRPQMNRMGSEEPTPPPAAEPDEAAPSAAVGADSPAPRPAPAVQAPAAPTLELRDRSTEPPPAPPTPDRDQNATTEAPPEQPPQAEPEA